MTLDQHKPVKKLRIGLLASSLQLEFQSSYLNNISKYCAYLNIDLITFSGLLYFSDKATTYHHNMYEVVKEFINKNEIDGLIILGGAISELYKKDDLEKIINSLKPIPMISIGVKITDISSLLIDNKKGIEEIVKHLVYEHNYERIGFIRGPEGHYEADQRFESYKNSIQNEGIDFDSSLVTQGSTFSELTGENGMSQLLQKNPKLDAVIAADDTIAIGALNYLKKQKIKVPYDISVTGFDDCSISELVYPPLTTVSQQFDLQAKEAIKLLLKQINREEIQSDIVLPTKIIKRESCGCIKSFSPSTNNYAHNSDKKYKRQYKILQKKLEYSLENNNKDEFTSYLKETISKEYSNMKSLNIWEKGIYSILSNDENLNKRNNLFIEYYKDSMDIYFHYRLLEKDRDAHRTISNRYKLQFITNQLLSTFTLKDLVKIIDSFIYNLGINKCYIVLYKKNNEQEVTEWEKPTDLELIYGTENKESIYFNSNKLLPDNLLSNEDNYIYIPLTFKNIYYGYILYSYNPQTFLDIDIYEIIATNISKALHSCFMRKNLEAYSIYRTNYYINMSQEIKNPLTIVTNYLNTYLSLKKDESDLVTANNIIKKLLNAVDAVTIYEKLSGKEEIYNHEEIVNFTTILKSKIKYFSSIASKHKIKILNTYSENIFVKIDSIALDTILNNLFDNAIRYNHTNGFIETSANIKNNRLFFSISNTGLTINKTDRDIIFEPFIHMENSHFKDGIGMSLGVVKKIINSVGGTIKLDTEVKNTQFNIVLPIESEYNVPQFSTSSNVSVNNYIFKPKREDIIFSPQKQTILVIEYNISLFSFLEKSLNNQYNIIWSKDTDEALLLLNGKEKPDIVLMDLIVESNKGFDLIADIKKIPDLLTIPILVITTKNSQQDRIKALKLGATDFITKPFLIEELLAKIKSLLKYKNNILNNSKKEIEKGLYNYLFDETAHISREAEAISKNNFNLTPKELYIANLLKEGKLYKEIAEDMGITQNTVKSHIFRIYKKCNINNKIELYNLQL